MPNSHKVGVGPDGFLGDRLGREGDRLILREGDVPGHLLFGDVPAHHTASRVLARATLLVRGHETVSAAVTRLGCVHTHMYLGKTKRVMR